MVATNVKIIDALKSFLDLISKDISIRQLFTTHPTDFSRNRKLPFKNIVGMLINLPKRSLDVELQSFFEGIGRPGHCCTKAAFSLQRTKLKPLFFQLWNTLLVAEFYTLYGRRVKRWEGFRLLAVDGSEVGVVDTPEALLHFGSTGNGFGTVPMGRAVQVHDVLNDLTILGGIFPHAKSENAVIASWVGHLPTDSLTLFDRGFPSYSLMYLMAEQETPRHFVMRCKATFSNQVKEFVAGTQKDMTVTLYPTAESVAKLKGHGYIVTRTTGLKVRMVKVRLPDGEVEVLLTNLYDKQVHTAKKMGKLYFMRWKIETTFGKQKNQMQMEIFSGHRVVSIEQDYAAGLFVSNLQAIVEKQCAAEVERIAAGRCHVYKINRNASWAALKDRIVQLFTDHRDSFAVLMELQCLFVKKIEPIRPDRHLHRPKIKRKRGKYHTYTNYRRSI